MLYEIFDLIKIFGALALFLYGIKIMSGGLQKLAGERLRTFLGIMTKNRFLGVIAGLTIAALIQSSSATTVMTVSFVNAGLLALNQAFCVIMGANIGTTITAWLISLFGFKLNFAILALPIIGLTFPFLFSKKTNYKYSAEILLGFAFLVMGFGFLKNAVFELQSNAAIFSFLQGFSGRGYASIFIYIAFGMALTIAIKSSSAVIALTLVICSSGWISFPDGVALILGSNIGTTITANLASLNCNTNAKRAALSHTVFNILGLVWVLILFNKYLYIIDRFLNTVGVESPFSKSENAPYALSIFHTSFNIINTFIWVWLTNSIMFITKFLVKEKKSDKEYNNIEYLNTGFIQLPELSLLEAKNMLLKYADISKRMFGFVKNMFHEKDENENLLIFERITKYEDIIDNIEKEISTFLVNISNKDVSENAKEKIRRMRTVIIQIEKIGDACNKMAFLVSDIQKDNFIFSDKESEDIEKMFLLVEEAFCIMFECINTENKLNFKKAEDIEIRINEFRNIVRDELYENLNQSEMKVKSGFFTNKLCTSCEEIGDNIFNINKVILGVNEV